MKFFVNGEQLFTIQDDSRCYLEKLAFMPRQPEPDMVTINFSELVINSIPQ